MFIYSLCLIYRRDGSEHLTGGFEKRLTQLPLRTSMLVLTLLYIRLFFFCITAGALLLLNAALFKQNVPHTHLIGLLEIYLVLQMVDWTRHTIRGLSWIPLFLFLAVILAVVVGRLPKDLTVLVAVFFPSVVSPWAFFVVFLTCTLVSWLGVHSLRRDTCYGVAGPLALVQHIREMGKVRTQTFSSPAEALLWYEWKRHGWKLPVRMVFVCVLLYLLYFAFVFSPDKVPAQIPLNTFVYGAPLIALLLVAPFTGWLTSGFRFILRRPQSQFPTTRPVTPLDHAWATWLTALKSLFLATAIAGCLSLTGAIAFASSDIHLLWATLQEGESNFLEVIMMYIAPILLTLLAAWGLYFKETTLIPLIPVLLILLYCAIGNIYPDLTDNPVSLSVTCYIKHEMPILTCMAVFFLSAFFSYAALAWYRRQVSWFWLLSLLLLWVLLTQQVLSLSADMHINPILSMVVVGCVGLIFIPFFAPFLQAAATVPHKPMTQMWRKELRSPWLFISIAIVTLCFGLCAFVLSQTASARQKLKEEGYPLSLAELNEFYKAVPEEENAALHYLKAYKKRTVVDDELYEVLPIVGEAEAPDSIEAVPEAMRLAIQQYLEENKETLALLREACAYSKSRYPYNYEYYLYDSINHYYKTYKLSGLLMLETLWESLNNHPKNVLDSLKSHYYLAQSLESDPTLLAQLSRLSAISSFHVSIQQALNNTHLTEPALATLQQLIGASNDPPAYLSRALKGEVAFAVEYYTRYIYELEPNIDHLLIMGYRFSGMERFHQTLMAQHIRNLLECGQESVEALRNFQEDYRYYKNSFVHYLNIIQVFSIFSFDFVARAMTEQNLVQTALAIERFERAEGQLPKKLTELLPNYLKEIPRDYFGDAPVLYQRTEKGYLVYGVERDGVDNEGLESPNEQGERDQVFRVERAVRVAE